VLIALGGGEHVHRWGSALANRILSRRPDTRIRIVTGFVSEKSVDDSFAESDAGRHDRGEAVVVSDTGHSESVVVSGFSRTEQAKRTRCTEDTDRVRWIPAPEGLASELRRAEVAVVAGGVTLYEAAALGTPSVALAVADAQQITIRGFALRGAAVDGGLAGDSRSIERAACTVASLLGDPARAARLGDAGARLVDGRGAFRVADAIRQLARRHAERIDAA
jgi:UDP-N-acetylglucosamine:LPS N-acetylglucosamine transferase